MKKSIIVTLVAMTAVAYSSFAQTSTEHGSKLLKREEVPASILQAFESSYGPWNEKGIWKEDFVQKTTNGRTVFTPEHFLFISKKNGQKVVIKFSPDGTLEEAKGIAKQGTSGSK